MRKRDGHGLEDAGNPAVDALAEQGPLRLALRPREAAQALGIGARLLWSLTNRGEIPHLRLGKRIVYPVAELERWLAERTKRKGDGP